MLNMNRNKVTHYIPMTIADDNVDSMVKLIRYEPLENFFSRHPSLTGFEHTMMMLDGLQGIARRAESVDGLQDTARQAESDSTTGGQEGTEEGSGNEGDGEDEDDEVFRLYRNSQRVR